MKNNYFFAAFSAVFVRLLAAVFAGGFVVFPAGVTAAVFTSFTGEDFAVVFAGFSSDVAAFGEDAAFSLTTGGRAGMGGGVVVLPVVAAFFFSRVSMVFFGSFAAVFFSIH